MSSRCTRTSYCPHRTDLAPAVWAYVRDKVSLSLCMSPDKRKMDKEEEILPCQLFSLYPTLTRSHETYRDLAKSLCHLSTTTYEQTIKTCQTVVTKEWILECGVNKSIEVKARIYDTCLNTAIPSNRNLRNQSLLPWHLAFFFFSWVNNLNSPSLSVMQANGQIKKTMKENEKGGSGHNNLLSITGTAKRIVCDTDAIASNCDFGHVCW